MDKALSPTAANIISSLGIKGAVSDVEAGQAQSSVAGFVPVLGENGKLNAKFIPSDSVTMQVDPLTNVYVVDKSSGSDVQTGSVVAPYKTINGAASSIETDESGRCAIIVAPGKYTGSDNTWMRFSGSPSKVFVIGVGECSFDSDDVVISGVSSGGSVYLQNIRTNSNLRIVGCSEVVLLGRSFVGGEAHVEGARLILSPESWVASTDSVNVSYTSEASRIGNDSNVGGKTVKDAIENVGGRVIRTAAIHLDSSSIDIGSSYDDIEVESSGGVRFYDLRDRDRVIVDGINKLIKLGKNIVADSVVAKKIVADEISAGSIDMAAIQIGGYKLTMDNLGYLAIADGSYEPHPPGSAIYIKDDVTGIVYLIGIANGRMYRSADDGSSHEETEIVVIDPETGIEYGLDMSEGRLYLASLPGESGGDEQEGV